jgi:cell division protein FtsA
MKVGDAVAAIDLGSSKITALLSAATGNGSLELRGAGVAESKGFRRDTLVSLEAAVEAIRQAVERAEEAAGWTVSSAVVGVAGSYIRGVNSRGGVQLGPRPREVTAEDVHRAIEVARSVTLPADQEVLHVVPQEFLLDNHTGIRDPLGLLGRRLEVNVHIVTGASMATQNLVTAVNRSGIVVEDTVLEPLAAADACLTEDERELGVVLADVGAGSTDWLVFQHGSLRQSGVVPVGGEHFTHDIAIGLRVPLYEAERIKRAYGCAALASLGPDSLLEVAGLADRPPRVTSRRALGEILEPRAVELLALLRDDLERSGTTELPPAGLVLTGGGAQLEGLVELAAREFQIPARVGLPQGLAAAAGTLSNPASAVAVGLLFHAHRLRIARRRQQEAGPWGRLRHFFQSKGWAA